jgi:hypothetical protein
MTFRINISEKFIEKIEKNRLEIVKRGLKLSAWKSDGSLTLTEIKSRRNFFGFFNHTENKVKTSFFY